MAKTEKKQASPSERFKTIYIKPELAEELERFQRLVQKDHPTEITLGLAAILAVREATAARKGRK